MMRAIFKFDKEFEIEDATRCFKSVVAFGVECSLHHDDDNDIILYIVDLEDESKQDVVALMSEIADIIC